MFEIIPAIDLKEGRCVRLVQGRMEEATVYFDDPLDAARTWEDQGAPRIHLVDLDGAVTGIPRNLDVVRRIVEALSVPTQLGGGMRKRSDVEAYLAIGVDRVILGTLALREPDLVVELSGRHPQRVLLGLDARNGFVAVEGWRDVSQIRAAELVRSYPDAPLGGVIYTDVERDGMLAGPNVGAIRDLLAISPYPVIASGGVTSLTDVRTLARLGPAGLAGAIVGKALYSGRLSYREAREAAGGAPGRPA